MQIIIRSANELKISGLNLGLKEFAFYLKNLAEQVQINNSYISLELYMNKKEEIKDVLMKSIEEIKSLSLKH